jgi:tricorn protease-like protein
MGWAPERLQILGFGGGKAINSFVVPQGRRLRWTPNGKSIIYPDISQGVWQQALNEERPRSVRGFEEMLVWHLDWSFDGKYLAYTTGPISQEIILTENFK